MTRATRAREALPACFGRQWCRPRQFRACASRKDCGARMETAQGLILSANIIIGYQVAFLLGACGWRMRVVHSDRHVYEIIPKGDIDIVVADIDAGGLGGMAALVYCQRRWPSITTFAITRGDDAYLEKLAHELGGCRDFFYLAEGRMEIDMHSGMAATLLRQASGNETIHEAPLHRI